MTTTNRTSLSRLASRRPLAVLDTAALCLSVLSLAPVAQATASVTAATAASDPSVAPEPDKGAPEQPEAAPTTAPNCTLTEPDQPDAEFARCSIVTVDAASAPSLTGDTTVAVTVRTQRPVKNAVLQLSSTTNLSIVSAPGFGAARPGVSGVGAVSSFSRPISSEAHGYQIYYVTVRATKGQPYATVQARLKTGDAQTNASGERTWQLGATTDAKGNHPTAAADTSSVAKPWTDQVKIGKGLTPPAPAGIPASISPNAPNASCATGGFFFRDENSVTTPAYNVRVIVWDSDSSGGDDALASGFANVIGQYTLCFESTDFDQGGGQEAYIQFVASNDAWRIRDTQASNQDWSWTSSVFNYGDPGDAHDYGLLQPANLAEHRALHAQDAVIKLDYWTRAHETGLDGQLVVNWTPTSTDGTYADVLGANDVHLAADDPDSDHITIHEGAHVLMDTLYEDDFPPRPNCSPHSIFGNSSTGCAWTEGWAEWVPVRVLNDPYFRFEDGTGPNLETQTWNDGNPHGDQAEGRIAGTLIDLSDGPAARPTSAAPTKGSGTVSARPSATAPLASRPSSSPGSGSRTRFSSSGAWTGSVSASGTWVSGPGPR